MKLNNIKIVNNINNKIAISKDFNWNRVFSVGKNTKNGTYLIEGRKTKNGFVEKIKVRVNENEKNPKFKLKVVEENNKKFLLFDDLGDRIKKYPLSWTLLERTENDKVEYTKWEVILDESDYDLLASIESVK